MHFLEESCNLPSLWKAAHFFAVCYDLVFQHKANKLQRGFLQSSAASLPKPRYFFVSAVLSVEEEIKCMIAWWLISRLKCTNLGIKGSPLRFRSPKSETRKKLIYEKKSWQVACVGWDSELTSSAPKFSEDTRFDRVWCAKEKILDFQLQCMWMTLCSILNQNVTRKLHSRNVCKNTLKATSLITAPLIFLARSPKIEA